MATTISSVDLVMLQGTNASTQSGSAQGGNATTKPTRTQTATPATKQDIQAAARDFSEAIRNSVQQRVNAAQIEQAVRQGVAGGVAGGVSGDQGGPVLAPAPPTPPAVPRVFTIQGPDGLTTITTPPRPFDDAIPPQAVDISIAFFLMIAAIIIGLPLARAFARRMDRRGAGAQIPNEVSSQLAHLNQAVDAIALEVERISEGQRFTTRLLSEQKEAARQPLSSGASR
jgi:hypothetical protein